MNNLETMVTIQSQAEADITETPALTEETMTLAEGKRWTFDIVETPIDPLR